MITTTAEVVVQAEVVAAVVDSKEAGTTIKLGTIPINRTTTTTTGTTTTTTTHRVHLLPQQEEEEAEVVPKISGLSTTVKWPSGRKRMRSGNSGNKRKVLVVVVASRVAHQKDIEAP